ncbi:hypothetical protein [Runella sp.]|uniref:hypothetical protein n=1 Tax=Runella sp. TaxID=1960881 RepID=UPI003D0ADC66
MAKPLKKLTRFVSRNRVFFIALGVALVVYLIWYYYQKSKVTTDTGARTAGKKYRVKQMYFDPLRVYKMLMVIDTDNWANRCRLTKAEGLDTIQLVVPISETFKGKSNYDFAPYIEFANVAADNGLYIVLKPDIQITGKILGSVFTQADMMQDRNGNRLTGATYQLSFASTKWNEVYNWHNKLQSEFRPFQDAQMIPVCLPTCHHTQEFVYNYIWQGDFSPIETEKSGGLNQMQNLDYLRYESSQLKEKFHAICNEFNGWRMGYDAGSFFIGSHRGVGSFDFENIANHPSIKFIKNNPRIFDSPEFNAALCQDWKIRTGKFWAVEWTNADGANADQLADRHRVSIQQGANLLSFAFHTPDNSGGGQGWEVFKQTRNRLQSTGDWDKPVQTPQRTDLLSYSLADIYNQNGYEGGLLGAFNTLKNNNGGVLPNVRCTG